MNRTFHPNHRWADADLVDVKRMFYIIDLNKCTVVKSHRKPAVTCFNLLMNNSNILQSLLDQTAAILDR